MELLFLAIALSMDSAALSIANGAKCATLNLFNILKISFIYGFFQAIMPILGYFLGVGFVGFISYIDHYIAFAILSVLGLKMIKDAFGLSQSVCAMELSNRVLILGAVATSIDALAVGVALSFEGADIFLSSLSIGGVCFAICVVATYLGRYLGETLEKKALILGGVILIVIGVKILISHLIN